jgi:hypothetical protein
MVFALAEIANVMDGLMVSARFDIMVSIYSIGLNPVDGQA